MIKSFYSAFFWHSVHLSLCIKIMVALIDVARLRTFEGFWAGLIVTVVFVLAVNSSTYIIQFIKNGEYRNS